MLSIYNKIRDYIIVLNCNGEIVFCNESFLKRLNYRSEKDINIDILDLLQNNSEKIIDESLEINQIIEFYSETNELVKLDCNITINEFNNERSIFIIGKEVKNKQYTMEMLEDLLDNMDVSTFILDKDEKYLYVNNAFALLANKKREDILGSYNWEHWKYDDYNEFKRNNNSVFDIKTPKIFNEKLIEGDDTYWYESYKAPIFDKDGKPKYIVATTKNINLSRALSEEQYKNYNMATISKEASNINENKNINIVLNKVGESIIDYTHADGISILLYNEEKGGLVPITSLGKSISHLKNVELIPINKESIKEAEFKKHHNCVSSKEEIIKLTKMPLEKMKDICFIGNYGIEIYDEYLGTICLSYEEGNEPKFNCDEYMGYICNKIAMIIKNTRLLYELSIENKKRRDTEKELEQYLNTAVDLVAILDKEGYFKRLSHNWTNVLGWSVEELLSMSIKDIIHQDERIKYRDKFDILGQSENIERNTIKLIHKDDKYITLEWSSKYIEEKEIYVTTARDITEYLEVEKEKRELEEAVQLEIVKNEFFSNMSHEFRTPINIILGTMQVINKNIEQDNIQADRLKKCSNYIKQNSYRLLRLVNNLIDISKMDIGMYELKCTNQNIVSVIEEITLSVADYIKENNINLIFDTDSEDIITYCDPDKIERIMLNLLSNAIKYTPSQGLIKVEISSTKDEVTVSVKDNGIGIPKEKLDVIFDRYGQVDDSLNKKCEGSGIGLSLVKNLVEMHNGKIHVISEEHKGAEFIFTIPIIEKEDKKYEHTNDRLSKHVERCDIEFSDIYDVK